jgi:two-component system CheB/CheR fusion protein
VRRNATFKDPGGQMISVEIEVIALRLTQSTPSYYLVLFQRPQSPSPERPIAAVSSSEIQSLGLEDARKQVAVVRNELETAREYLQSITEEHEATTEELRSANEEILSSNEELQSTNEELQTAKEEMQSANEELRTVNDELNNRNTELARANDDLVNLFAGVNIPIVMVNRELRIRRYTAPAERLLNVI